MSKLVDTYHRSHSYLRISLTEKCNLRCVYCMPENGIPLKPASHLMNSEEVLAIAEKYVQLGVRKIRLTGGEPFVRKDFEDIFRKLNTLPVELAMTTNGILLQEYDQLLNPTNLKSLNISLDTLKKEKFIELTRRNEFYKVRNSIDWALKKGWQPKINVVLMKGTNEDEIIDFINWSYFQPVHVRFIEFMPFNGNKWDSSKCVSESEILQRASEVFEEEVIKLEQEPNGTSRNYAIHGGRGSFGIISTVTNPFCDSCNRIRLTADGKVKNCLFSKDETDLLTALREGKDIEPLIFENVRGKKFGRGSDGSWESFSSEANHQQNRSMIAIGG